MKTILLVGFRTFGSYLANSTELLAKRLQGEQLAGRHVHTLLFDATIPTDDRGSIVMDTARSVSASAIIALGMASQKKGFSIETVARNRVLNDKYCAHLNNTPVDPTRPYDEVLNLNLRQWHPKLFLSRTPSLPLYAELSSDPGGFCCNHLIYQLRQRELKQDVGKKIPWIYVHVPCSPECVAPGTENGKTILTIEQMRSGLRLLLGSTNI